MNCHDLDKGLFKVLCPVYVWVARVLCMFFGLLDGYSDASLYNGSLAKIRCHPSKLRH